MVQILPPKTSLGNAWGQSFGAGFGAGSQQALNVGFQRNLVQDALEGLKTLPKNATAYDATQYLLQATAGLPDQGRIMQALAPYLIGGQRTGQVFGGMAGGAPQPKPSTGTPVQTEAAKQAEGGAAQQPQAQVQQQPQSTGYFQRPKTPQEINQFAANYAMTYAEDPNAYLRGKQIADSENASIQKSWNDFESKAIAQNPNLQKRPDRIPVYNQILQKYGDLQDPNEIMKKANEEYGHVANLLDSFGKGNVPGIVQGTVKKLGPFLPLGKIFMQSGDTRDKALRQLHPTAKKIMEMGFEPQLRSEIQQRFALSPTEVEETLRPLSAKNTASLGSLPDAKKVSSPEEREKKLVDFFKHNVTPDTSLLALRHRLWNDKGYGWEEIAQAINNAGLDLNARQAAEGPSLAQAPIQSLNDIFRDSGNWIDYFRGAK